MKVDSYNDAIELTDTAVVIRKSGLANAMASGMNGERTIGFDQITSVGFKTGGMFSPGFIQFTYAGSAPFRGGLIAATQDPDAFVFEKARNGEMEKFREELEARRKALKAAPNVESSLVTQLASLAILHAEGHLSDADFQQAKTQILGA